MVAAVLLVTTGCSTAEIAKWIPFARPLAGGAAVPCAQWIGTSRVAGFTDAQIRVEHQLMRAESGCNPNAHNPSGATGLLQVMPFWAKRCGGTPDRLYEPQFNVSCARIVYGLSGWGAWSTYRTVFGR